MIRLNPVLCTVLLTAALCLSCKGPVRTLPSTEEQVPGPKVMYVDCRAEVRTMKALKEQARRCAAQGMNAMIMEWEATFPFESNATLKNPYAFTKEEIRDFVEYCSSLGLEVIPLQNCFGHCEYILRHERYWSIREDRKNPSQVCPLKVSKAIPIFKDIFAEVAALHPSKYFHIGCDETFLLGSCRDCSAFAATHGKSHLFVDYVKEMCRIVLDMGKIPVMWADIITAHPEAIDELPKELIFIDWNYGWNVNKFGSIDTVIDAGVHMWGATALRSGPDNLYLTQWAKHFENLRSFVSFGREHGYRGFVQTSWSTSGAYGFHYDLGNEILNIQPVRLVYPESGFNILVAATARAFNQAEPFEAESFVREYASEIYGFGEADAATLWDYFQMPQDPVSTLTGKASDGRSIDEVLEECLTMRSRLAALPRARSNREEIAHYLLMLDIRINYLKFKSCEAIFESAGYEESQRQALADRMKKVCSEGRKIDKRFASLNKGYLKPGEIRYLTSFRGAKMEAFLRALTADEK